MTDRRTGVGTGWLGAAVLMLIGCLLGVLLAESLFRGYLYVVARDRFVRKLPTSHIVQSQPVWTYDERFGYVYPKDEKVPAAIVSNGRVAQCGDYPLSFNAEGNPGQIEGDYRTAALKILVFGDSFTASTHDGVTWPLLLQRRLASQLGRTVHVTNFGRDGYGVLQMFDLAAAKVSEWKPNLFIFAFITNDLQRVRFWRAVTKVEGHWRYLVSPEPTPTPDPTKSYDTGLYHPGATRDWCRRMKASGARDEVLTEVERVYQRGVGVGERRTADIWTVRHSYLLTRLLRGTPFHDAPGPFLFPTIEYRSYARDSRFIERVRALKATAIPFHLVHLAFYPEFTQDQEYIVNYTEAGLLRSLADVTGQPVMEMLRHVRRPVESPERLIMAPDNYHPSMPGLEFYADAVADMLLRNGMVK